VTIRSAESVEHLDRDPLSREQMAQLVANDIPPGSFVNLGIGLPTMVSDHLAPESNIVLHTENGLLGMGPLAHGSEVDSDLINAGKIAVTEVPGAAYLHQADSFAMIRGGHLDICVLGAFQVSVRGDLANWHTGTVGSVPAVGGAMDLAAGARSVWVTMTLFDKAGRPKLLPACTYPLTAAACVTRVYTDHATLEISSRGVKAIDTFGSTVHELSERLGLTLGIADGDTELRTQ
jgi:3-oxoadipate CoA-transferase beta subunit